MKRIIYILLLLIAVASQANDGIYYTSGNELVPLQETDIRVRKEILTISLQDNGQARVDVYYEFYNPADSPKTLLMGFEAMPSYNDGDSLHTNGVHPHIKEFSVSFNGHDISYRNAVCKAGEFKPLAMNQWRLDDEVGEYLINKTDSTTIDNFAYVYYFDATFKPGVNKVHHTYLYTMSVSVGNTFEVPYKLSPAGRWAGGRIDDFTLTVRADNTAKHFLVNEAAVSGATPLVAEGTGKTRLVSSRYDESEKLWEVSLRNGAISMHLDNFSPDANHELRIISADLLTNYNEDARFGEFYDRSSDISLRAWQTTSHKQHLTKAQTRRIAHNLPYAQRGHVFKSATLKHYFESLWWYMPDPSYADDTQDFTPVDWQYVRL